MGSGARSQQLFFVFFFFQTQIKTFKLIVLYWQPFATTSINPECTNLIYCWLCLQTFQTDGLPGKQVYSRSEILATDECSRAAHISRILQTSKQAARAAGGGFDCNTCRARAWQTGVWDNTAILQAIA